MKVLAVLSHPGHYYLFKYLAYQMNKKGHEVKFAIRGKDILEDILKAENVDYKFLCKEFHRGNTSFSIMKGAILEMLAEDFHLFKYSSKFKPDLFIGTDISISHVGKLLGIPSIVFNEDDYEINKLFCKATYPFATHIIAPNNCSVGPYERKKIGYDGFQKMAYMHPKFFRFDKSVVEQLGLNGQPFFLIRLVNLKAIHDIEGNATGITPDILRRLIKLLEVKGKVFINAEGEVDSEFENYVIRIKPNKMHSVMAAANLFIGDSQSMSTEAGLLGTPFIRFNDFVGKINVLNDIENIYKLGFGVKTDDIDRLFRLVEEIINTNNIKEIYKTRAQKLFDDKLDVTDFWIWLIENYPNSINILKKDPDYQVKFSGKSK